MKYIKLSEICDLQNGYAFKSNDYVDYSNTMNCRMSNIRPGAIFDLNYSPKYLPDDFAEKYSDYLLNDEDVVIAMTDLAGDPKILGVPAQVITNGKNVLLNQRVGRLILKNKEIDFSYLKYNLSNPKNKEYYKRFSGGGLQINISKKDILNLEIPLHDKQEQLQIANKLDNIQKLIDIRREEIDKCNNLIKSQFVEMFGDLNKYPLMTYKDCTNFVDYRGHTPKLSSLGNIRMINAKSVGKGFFKYIDEYVTEETYQSWMHRGFGYPGDVLFVTEGHTFGNTCLIPDDLTKFALGQRVLTIKCKEMINNVYLNHYMQTNIFIDRINVYKTGGTAQGIRSKDLLKVEIPVPSLDEQNRFAKIVKQIDKQKFEFEKSLKKLEELQASLMQEYFG